MSSSSVLCSFFFGENNESFFFSGLSDCNAEAAAAADPVSTPVVQTKLKTKSHSH
jgi:hypothetical protein